MAELPFVGQKWHCPCVQNMAHCRSTWAAWVTNRVGHSGEGVCYCAWLATCSSWLPSRGSWGNTAACLHTVSQRGLQYFLFCSRVLRLILHICVLTCVLTNCSLLREIYHLQPILSPPICPLLLNPHYIPNPYLAGSNLISTTAWP